MKYEVIKKLKEELKMKKEEKKDHGIIWKIGAFIIGNIGFLVLTGIAAYLAYIWYPYTYIINYLIHLFSGDKFYLYHFIYYILIPYGILITLIVLLIAMVYFPISHAFFPELYLDEGQGDKRFVGKVYYKDKLKNVLYVRLHGWLNPLQPRKSMSKLYLCGATLEREGTKLIVKADGIVHLKDDIYEFYRGTIPTQDIEPEVIEKLLDEAQAKVGYRTMKSMHYNSELNKGKYKSVIALWPSWILSEKRRAPEESYKGVVQTLQENINMFNQIYEQSNTDELEREQLAENLAPIAIQVYRDAKALEEYFPELRDKNKKVEKKIKQMNESLAEIAEKASDEVYYIIDIDTMVDYVRDVEAVLRAAEDLGVIEE